MRPGGRRRFPLRFVSLRRLGSLRLLLEHLKVDRKPELDARRVFGRPRLRCHRVTLQVKAPYTLREREKFHHTVVS